ncbi:MAG: site-specific DNA-methyltransferase [Streptococcaceae bacterium]|jgi:adenine-specific DNA-methyltransferase|nr:site-specific DNA-methyltransferase [Streptococcaceae bacterium]
MGTTNFNERPHKNEKAKSVEYVKSLINQAKADGRKGDIIKLEELIRLLDSKKYGLVWEEHAELVEEEMKTKIPVFVEDKSKKIHDNPNSEDFNFLLEGDNLHSLHLLEKTHAGKIDVIYIDPPYNTGNKDFKYNDVFVDSEDTFRHSKWLSFMERRLRIAQKLLTIDGVIFVSIGDDEASHLKLLLDEIFGEQNFVNQISVKTKQAAGASGGGEDKKLKKNIEYLFVYSKSVDYMPIFNTVYKKTEISTLLEQYKQENKSWKYTSVIVNRGEKEYIGSTVDGSGSEIKIYKRNNAEFKSINRISKNEDISEQEVYVKYFEDIFVTAMPQSSIRPRVLDYIGSENLDKNSVYSIEYIPKSGRNKGKLYEQFYKGEKLRLFAWFSDVAVLEDGEVYKNDIEGTLWDGINLNNLSKEGNVSFDNGKKPLDLMQRIIKMFPYSDSTILDFFAGSGSTAHAVIKSNIDDSGNRKFILATNDEVVETTYQRMKNITQELPMNLKYFKTDFIVKGDFPDVSLEYELLKYVTPLVELEFTVDIANPKVQIVLTEEQLEMLIENHQLISNSTLFMHPDVFRDAEQNQILSDLQIKVQEIPNYFFGTELWSK